MTSNSEKAIDWKTHWPDATNCPCCGSGMEAFRFLHLCSNTKRNIQPVYDTWLECSCGRKGKSVSRSFQDWYFDLSCGGETILIAAIEKWNRDCQSFTSEKQCDTSTSHVTTGATIP